MLQKSLLAQALLSATLVLTGCGGGSGGSSDPATQPPAGNPPAGNPPATNPPVTNPPATNPPATNPPVNTPAIEQALFSAKADINSGNELWITDGTDSGTKLVKDINASGDSNPYGFTKVGNKWFFVADDGINGEELWVTDGTEAGTLLIEDIRAGATSSFPRNLIAYKGKLIFSATDNTGDTELWISDGTSVGTKIVKNIAQGNSGSNIAETVLFNGEVYFRAQDQNYLRPELWKTDGTAAGTVLAARINNNHIAPLSQYAGSIPSQLTVFNNQLIMTADSLKSLNTPIEIEPYIYSADGSVSKMRDINAGPNSSLPNEYTVAGDNLFFAATDGSGLDLWAYTKSKALNKISAFAAGTPNAPKFLTAVGDKLYFVGTSTNEGAELWVSDGTPAGTSMVKDIIPGNSGSAIRNLKSIGSKLLFVARDDLADEDALWVSDGTAAGTVEVSKISSTGSDPDMKQFITINNKLLFSADDAIKGTEVWSSDGTTANTTMVKDINPDAIGSNPEFIKPILGQPAP